MASPFGKAWDSRRPPRPELIDDCVHCGFCLHTCPSYSVFELEGDSPRGRIALMKAGHGPGSSFSPEMAVHLDRCLGCMACVTSCPSGVRYDQLIERARPQRERRAPRSWRGRAFRRLILGAFTRPGVLRCLVPLIWLQRRMHLGTALARLLPRSRVRGLIALAPDVRMRAMTRRAPRLVRAQGGRRGQVALMQGCVQRVFFSDVNSATIRVLAAEGWEVHTVASPRCCGALALHAGSEASGLAFAKATIGAYEKFDHVVVNVAGCGSAMKDYGRMLDDDLAWRTRAREFSARVRDVHELLDAHPARAPRGELSLRVAYHDACHLAHAQAVREQPRRALTQIPGLTLVEPEGWEICCGSAGIYNLTEPDAAARLGAQKAEWIQATAPDVIAAANPGCSMQIAAHLDGTDPIPILHPVSLVDMSITKGRNRQ